MLRIYHARDLGSEDDVKNVVVEHCDQIVKAVDWADFAVESTRRQFQRYVDWWENSDWFEIAKAAVAALTRE